MLTWFERKACSVMSRLRFNGDGKFYKCRFNSLILNVARILLKGKDPIAFADWLLWGCADYDPDIWEALK